MAEENPQSRSPGTQIVPRRSERADSGAPSALLLATDLALGATTQATRLALQVGATGWHASLVAGRLAAALPGANGAGRLLNTAARPLVDSGREMRTQTLSAAQARMQRLLEAVRPGLVDALDIDQLVSRIDIDQLVRRIEIDDLVKRIDIDQLVSRIELDALMQRIDLDAVVESIDVNRIAERIDVDAVVEQTELGTIVARSTSGFASEALDAARSQTADVDTRVSRVVNRVLRRKEGDVPVGPPLLTGETGAEDTAAGPDASDGESM